MSVAFDDADSLAQMLTLDIAPSSTIWHPTHTGDLITSYSQHSIMQDLPPSPPLWEVSLPLSPLAPDQPPSYQPEIHAFGMSTNIFQPAVLWGWHSASLHYPPCHLTTPWCIPTPKSTLIWMPGRQHMISMHCTTTRTMYLPTIVADLDQPASCT